MMSNKATLQIKPKRILAKDVDIGELFNTCYGVCIRTDGRCVLTVNGKPIIGIYIASGAELTNPEYPVTPFNVGDSIHITKEKAND